MFKRDFRGNGNRLRVHNYGLSPEEVAALKVSKSGLYLDEVEGGLNMRSIVGLDSCRNFAQMAFDARETARKKLEGDILASISKKYQTGKAAFVGHIGRPSYMGTLSVSQRWQFVKIQTAERSDAIMQITGLRIILDSAINTTVKILKVEEGGNQGTEILTADILTVANTYTNVPIGNTSLALPLTENGKNIEYYVIWDRGATNANPKDIKLSCNCPGGDGFSQFVKAIGGEMSDINMLGQVTKTSGYSQGISLDVDIRCVPGRLVCREYDKEDAIAITMAWAMMYKTQEILIEKVMGSNEVNRYTMMNREYLWGKRNHFVKEYEGRIPYLASVIDVLSSDCFVCREMDGMFVGGILS